MGGTTSRPAATSPVLAPAVAPAPQPVTTAAAAATASRVTATPYGSPPPPVLHLELTTAAPGQLRGGGRVVIVGDVHGCSDELTALLAKLGFIAGLDNLLLVGDLVIRTARELGAWAARGNHDDAALAAHREIAAGRDVPGKHKWAAGLSEDREALDYLTRLPFSISLPQLGLLVVHAGVIPGVNLASQDLAVLYKMRDLTRLANDASWEWLEKGVKGGGSAAWAKCWDGPQHVVFGHDAKRGLQRERAATGLDTGCVYGNSLTACVLPPPDGLASSEALRAKLSARRPPRLQDLGAELVSVPAARVYAKKDDDGSGGKASKEGGKEKGKEGKDDKEGKHRKEGEAGKGKGKQKGKSK
ncbi:hypothetical protein MNEG_3468 [Monoraphidium neglectum]|uniref:Calcineurin-like phosphoesterase domain-containing protein n=1 Tax=Monoraphidium neglectum TaxID=145388 RepID=A0A0D2K1L9_9CHLO|nr:hypothetical protein MNEG_3468 [Monoraphidium neglectum]KIZ04488.1 hypothetical protein MNEG_3468 [Monoraphidium neglectum]|eukprot:XP_013903507.1 hypothetical protein MNEG_3468 [Monoraphidium neglectum]